MSQNSHTNGSQVTTSLLIRPGDAADQAALHQILLDAVWDLAWRIGIQDGGRFASAEERAADLARWQPILDHLTATADQFWVAEQEGKPVGYARSILRDGVRELTEFFVSPDAQTGGIGRALLARAMPPGAAHNYIIATLDLRAQARYHKLGIYQICAVYTFLRKPERTEPQENSSGNVAFVPITPEHFPALAQLDLAVHGHRRDEDHAWLMKDRTGFLMLRQGQVVGYGYVGRYSGPFVMLDGSDYPAALAHAESIAAAQGLENFGLDVPMLNRTAVAYLLGRGYQMSPFFCFYMCDAHPPHVAKTIVTAPMIMI
jgi:GNAT superfamily N-acetyltransferase